jgi:hypothetical protein
LLNLDPCGVLFSFWLAMVMAGAIYRTLAMWNVGIAFVAGSAVYLLARRGVLKVSRGQAWSTPTITLLALITAYAFEPVFSLR